MTKNHNVSVSMNQAAAVKTGMVFKQGDFGFNLVITVLDFDVTGSTPQIVFRKPMGAVESTTITVSGNTYTYTMKGTELDTPGKVFCDLKLKNSTTQRISSASFMFEVVADTLDGLAEEASSYSDTIAEITERFDDEMNEIKTAIIDGELCQIASVEAGTTPGACSPTGDTSSSETSYIQQVNVKGYDKIKFHVSSYVSNLGYFWTDKDSEIITGAQTTTAGTLTLDIPKGAIYLTTCWRKTEDQQFILYKLDMKNAINELEEIANSYLETLPDVPVTGVVSDDNGYIKITTTAGSWRYMAIPVTEGEKYYINTLAYGNNYDCLLYADSNGAILLTDIKAGVSVETPILNYLTIAPTNAATLYVNQRASQSFTASIIKVKADTATRFAGIDNVLSPFSLSDINSEIIDGKVIYDNSGSIKTALSDLWKYIEADIVENTYLVIKTIAYGTNRYPVVFADANGGVVSTLFLQDSNTETVIEKEVVAPLTATKIYVNCRKNDTPAFVPYIKAYAAPANIIIAKNTISGDMIKDNSIPPEKLSENYSIINVGLPLMDNARAKVMALNKENKYMNFLFITDTHVMGNEGVDLDRISKNNLRLFSMMANEKWANFCVHGGDGYTSYNLDNAAAAKTIDDALRPLEFSQIPVYVTKGNHDTNGKYKAPVSPSEQADPDWEHNTYYIQSASGSYGYLQVTEETWDGTSQLYKLDNEERITKYQWFMLTENNLDVSRNQEDIFGGYYYKDFDNERVRIIILQSYEPEHFEDTGFSTDQIQWICESALNTEYNVVVFTHYAVPNGLFKAFVDGDTYTNGSYSYDFGEQNVRNFVAVIHGHTHLDEYSSSKGFNYIGCDCGFCDQTQLNTDAEYCYTVFTIDTDEQKLYSTRIGRGTDHSYTYDTPGQIN